MEEEVKIVGFTPHAAQRYILQEMKRKNAAKITALAIGRQGGKTILAEHCLLDWSINTRRPVLSWFVTPTYMRSKAVYKELRQALEPLKVAKFHDTELTIVFANGSKIEFKSAEKYDNLRGPTLDYLIIDEFAFIRREAWEEVLRAMVIVKGKRVLLISTPKGKNLFFEIFQRGRSGEDKNYRSFRAPSSCNPYFDLQELEDVRRTLPPDVFNQEYLAAFVDNGGTVFRRIKEICTATNSNPAAGMKHFCGIDLGKQDDFTVITILDAKGRAVYWKRFRHSSWPVIVAELLRILKAYGYPQGYIEANGIGDPVLDFLYKADSRLRATLKPWITTNDTKAEAIEGLVLAMELGTIQLPNEADLIHELEVFTFNYSRVLRKITYSAPPGFHDDTVVSASLANMALRDAVRLSAKPIFSGIN